MRNIVGFILIVIGAWLVYTSQSSSEGFDPKTYTPMMFNIGLDKTPMTKSANMCNNTAMYSTTPITVDYTDDKGGNQAPTWDCACTEFIQAP